jgi:hypothetical protein
MQMQLEYMEYPHGIIQWNETVYTVERQVKGPGYPFI